ncbi:MAG: hypothetical protein CVV64_07605 [Candidatus Wallbacteria bacterium HGW-Wallbacteria-1]|jgi:homoserine acetyltransferase|uniref:Uncharacterized protein n=1 Tax=Candidatus Wallbacteria bacterium HGW-Wallbacteria-1 TaxID=2013854 RepID=A0A2N1PQW0_9BACT|nr:MAG: hypothetical protein CVV64_07605 [Candidatus Wallbacteria bacterium HGW-Wallbacteria-1]
MNSFAYSDTSAVAKFDTLKKYHTIPEFRIGGDYDYSCIGDCLSGGVGGTTLESLGAGHLRTSWIELGSRHLDSDGEVDNAILICPYYSGDSTNMMDFWHFDGDRTDFSLGAQIGPGLLFDTDKYCILLFDAVGLWGSSRPGASMPGCENSVALGLEFPRYSVEDCVQAIYLTLTEHLGIKRLKLVTGVSFGATMTYCWSVMHPDFMEAILPVGGTVFQDRGMIRWLFDLVTSAVQSDPVYRSTIGNYYHLPRSEWPVLGNMFAWSILKQSAFVDEYRITQSHEQYILEAFDWNESMKTVQAGGIEGGYSQSLLEISRAIDSNDLIYRNICQSKFNVEEYLCRVKARALIIHVDTDQWIRAHIARRAADGISGAKLLTFDHDFGHYAVFRVPSLYKKEISDFIDPFID